MKVLVIPTWYPSGADKLLGIYHKDFTKALAQNKTIDVDMLYIDRQRLKNFPSYFKMRKKSVEVEDNYKVYKYPMLNVSPISFKLQLYLYTKKMEKAFLDYIKENGKPGIIHSHVMIPAGYAATKIGKKYNIPVIVTEHSSYFKRYFKKGNIKYSNYILKNATISTVSNYMKNEILNYTDKCEIIPNFVDTELFKNNTKKKTNKKLRLVSTCALRQGKRVDDILKALKIIIKDYKINNIHLDIVGDGYYMNYYKQVCSDLKLNSYVSFLGKKERNEVAEILKNEDIFIISSDIETFSITGIEALSSGLPIVSTKCMGPEEYINNDTGILCEVGNPNDMARAIIECSNKTYDVNKLRKTALIFDKDVVINKTIKIYKNIIKNH